MSINNRKLDHLRAFDLDPEVNRDVGFFDAIQLTHRALPEIALDDVDTSVDFLGKRLRAPIIISSMTGGNDDMLRQINRNLALAAEACGVAMAVGSQRVMFADSEAQASFALREFAPNTVLIANLGAVQLNKGFTQMQCQKAIDVLSADGLYLHLNPLQEAVQPEGDTDFSALCEKIGGLKIDKPILLKEVGAGLSLSDVTLGLEAGITHFDVAGRGGTSWSRIEYHRRKTDDDRTGLVFQDWGLPTTTALQQLNRYRAESNCAFTLIASGGLRHGLDLAKAIVLGASLGGFAGQLLKPAQMSVDAVITEIEQIQRELKTAMFLLGTRDVESLRANRACLLEN